MQKLNELLQRRIWLGLLIALILGLALGTPLGWLTVSWRPLADDVAAIADSYSLNNDVALAKARLQGLSKDELARILTRLVNDSTAANRPLEAERYAALAQALGVTLVPAAPVIPGPTPAPTRVTGGVPTLPVPGVNTLITLGLVFLVVAALAVAVIFFALRVLPRLQTARATRAPLFPFGAAKPAAREGAAAAPTAATTLPGGLGRYVASYTLGEDNYDVSFSLETARQEFLGECGMGISEKIGEGPPDKVTAFDLWLFDKADVRTVTQILMSAHAFDDPGLRAKLATKGEALRAEKGKPVTLETQSLRIDAEVKELVYATSPGLPPNSHFQKLTVEIVPSLKEAVA